MRVTSYHRSPRHTKARQKKVNNLVVFSRVLTLLAVIVMSGSLYFVSNGEVVKKETIIVKTTSLTDLQNKAEYEQKKHQVINKGYNDSRSIPSYGTIKIIEKQISNEEKVSSSLGDSIIKLDDYTLTNYDLPSVKYPNMDFSSFQPFMDYNLITNTSTQSYKVSHSNNAYTDKNGLRRMRIPEGEFKIDGLDDYIVALGTFYKEKGTAGQRYLVVTTTGMFTITAGDEKSDNDTDAYNMVTTHTKSSAMIEWIVDTRVLDKDVKTSGNVTDIPIQAIKGDILFIYEINKNPNC